VSGRKSKEARRLAASAPQPPARVRDPKLLLLTAGVAAVLVVAAIVGLSLTLGASSKHASVTSSAKLPQAATVGALFRGLPQHGLVLGTAAAPVTLVEYLDLQCPWCGKFARESFPMVVSDFVRTRRVRVEMRPLDFVGSDSARGRNALLAAAEQNKAFQFAALLYENQGTENTGWLSDAMVRAAAVSIAGLDAAKVVSAGPSAAAAGQIEQERASQGVTGVPTFFVRRTGETGNGTMLVNPSAAALAAALRNAA
jgi:protein-disulfide isomerase